jgi:hypothetical protein
VTTIHPVVHAAVAPAVKPSPAPVVKHAVSAATVAPKPAPAPVKATAPVIGSTLIAAQASVKPGKATPAASTPTATFVNLVEGDTIQLNLNNGASSTSRFGVTGLPQWLSIDNKTGVLSGTVMAEDNKTYEAKLTIEDSAARTSTTKTLEINVLPHHYTGWNIANVTQLAEPTKTTTVTDAFGKTTSFTYPSPAVVG